MDLIPSIEDALQTWLVDLSGNIAVSAAGVAFLDAQIADLENKCAAGPTDEDCPLQIVRGKRLEAVPAGVTAISKWPIGRPFIQEKES